MARLIVLLLLAGCGGAQVAPARPAQHEDAIVWDFEQAVKQGREPYLALFDLAAVGKFEKLLHRYDVLGRSDLPPEWKAAYEAEDATPFTVERERTNVGNFYPLLGTRTVGTGGCERVAPVSEYARLLGQAFEPLPAGLEHYDALRQDVNQMIARGGLVAMKCRGGKGRLALVWTASDSPRGYDLITMYDDVD